MKNGSLPAQGPKSFWPTTRSEQLHARERPAEAGAAAFGVDAGRAAIGRGLALEVGDLAAVHIKAAAVAADHQFQFIRSARLDPHRAGRGRRQYDMPDPVDQPVD